MKFNVLRSVAVTLSMGACSIASAQYNAPAGYGYPGFPGPAPGGVPQTQAVQSFGGVAGYDSASARPSHAANLAQHAARGPQATPSPNYQIPAKWNTFGVSNPGPTLFQPASTGDQDDLLAPLESIPTPAPEAKYGGGSVPSVSPTIAPQVQPQRAPLGSYPPPPAHYATPTPSPSAPNPHGPFGAGVDENGSTYNEDGSPYLQAATQPWEAAGCIDGEMCGIPARPALYPWFGSFDLLFFNLDTNSKSRSLISAYDGADAMRPYLPTMSSSTIDPDSALGYSLSIGRYLGCGQFGLGVTYFNFNPDDEQASVMAPMPAMPIDGGLRTVGMPQYHNARMAYSHDDGAGGYAIYDGGAAADGVGYTGDDDYQVYHIIDGRAGSHGTNDGMTPDSGGAQRFRARRDVDIQGIEVNFFSFGLIGAQRAAAMPCGDGAFGSSLKSFVGLGGGYGGVGGYGGPNACAPQFGFGGAAGPLVRPAHGKVQVVTSHGFRWFQFEDSVHYAYDVDGRMGYTDHDIYDDTQVDNNLFGYQFGSRLVYCLGHRLNLNLVGKLGVYGNNIEQRHRLGSQMNTATLVAMPDLEIDFESEDTALATLCELDLGLGYRVSNAWTFRGGYRVMGVTGIATADHYARDYSSTANAMAIDANNSLLLHGAYVGADFNW